MAAAPARTRRRELRPVRPAGWWLDGLMVAGFVAVTLALLAPPVRALDLAVRDLVDAHRPPAADTAAQIVNRLGSGGILAGVALVLALLLAWRARSLWPVAPVLAAFLLTGAVIQPVKLFLHRAAPHSPLPDDVEVRLFSQDGGLSYPSGHAVNTIVWYGVLVLLLATWFRPFADRWLRPTTRRWIRWLPPVVVGFTSTYLGYHWLTDMFAGLCLGVLIDRAVARTPWRAEPESRSDSVGGRYDSSSRRGERN